MTSPVPLSVTLRRTAGGLLAAIALTAVAGCTGSDDQPENAAAPQPEPSVASSSAPATPSPTASASASQTPSAGGTTTASPTTALLAWKPLPGDPADTITTNGRWTLTIAADGRSWRLTPAGKGPGRTFGASAPHGERIMKAGLNGSFAVVVYGTEAGTRPETAAVTDLGRQRTSTIDAADDAAPASDTSWSLYGTHLWYATGGQGGTPYCLASADLDTGRSAVGWCADAHHGFTNIMAADGPTAMMTFDDARPTSCRTLVTVSGEAQRPGKEITPVPGVPACKGSQAVALAGSTVWSMVPDEHRYQQIHVYASASDGGVTDLGLGVNNTLARCGDSIFWAKNATGSAPAALMRWDGSALTTAYETKGFLGQPLCAGDRINIAESGTARDRQLTATVD